LNTAVILHVDQIISSFLSYAAQDVISQLLSQFLMIGQDWGSELFECLQSADGKAYSNYAVGYNNVKVEEATKRGIPVGNTPGNITMARVRLCSASGHSH
jgi:hydroxypyruvate reductase 1